MALTLTSSVFGNGERIPTRFTCEGEDISPPLQWRDAPPETRSFVLICDDPDAPGKTWNHWGLYDISAETDKLDAGYPTAEKVGDTRQAVNDFGRTGYGGPCPPKGHGSHHYQFRLLALDVERLEVRERPTVPELEKAARAHTIAEDEVVGIYSR